MREGSRARLGCARGRSSASTQRGPLPHRSTRWGWRWRPASPAACSRRWASATTGRTSASTARCSPSAPSSSPTRTSTTSPASSARSSARFATRAPTSASRRPTSAASRRCSRSSARASWPTAASPPDDDGWCSLSLHAGGTSGELRRAGADPDRLLDRRGLAQLPAHVRHRRVPPRAARRRDRRPRRERRVASPPPRRRAERGRRGDRRVRARLHPARRDPADRHRLDPLGDRRRASPRATRATSACTRRCSPTGLMRLHQAGKVSNAGKGAYDGVSVATFAARLRGAVRVARREPRGRLPSRRAGQLARARSRANRGWSRSTARWRSTSRARSSPTRSTASQFSGIGGHEDFVAGPALDLEDRSLLCFPSTAQTRGRQTISRIVPWFERRRRDHHAAPPGRRRRHRVRGRRAAGQDRAPARRSRWPRSPHRSSATVCARRPSARPRATPPSRRRVGEPRLGLDLHAAWQALRPLLDAGGYLPWSEGALRPAALRSIANEIMLGRRRSIVELGSGVSTIVLARLLRERGGELRSGRARSAVGAVRARRARARGLTEFAEVVEAPLEPASPGDRGLRLVRPRRSRRSPQDRAVAGRRPARLPRRHRTQPLSRPCRSCASGLHPAPSWCSTTPRGRVSRRSSSAGGTSRNRARPDALRGHRRGHGPGRLAAGPAGTRRAGVGQLRLVEPLAQLVGPSNTATAPAASSSSREKPPLSTADRRDAVALRRLDLPDGVADHHRFLPPRRLLARGGDQVGLGLGRLDVGRGGPAVDEIAGSRAGRGSARPPSPSRRRRG